mmetsp:Transcript_23481/g.38719  ORF Transcript_23481/g.38719 Transcript_23481/m.38719 type:complete len:129 (+) Transcript_23481:183-569(+)
MSSLTSSSDKDIVGALNLLMFSVKSVIHAGGSNIIAWDGESCVGNDLHRWGKLYILCDLLDGGVKAGTTGLGRNGHSFLWPCGVTAAGLNGNVDRVGVDGDPGIMGAVLSRFCSIMSDSCALCGVLKT